MAVTPEIRAAMMLVLRSMPEWMQDNARSKCAQTRGMAAGSIGLVMLNTLYPVPHRPAPGEEHLDKQR